MRFSVLGRLEVISDDGARLDIPQPRQRALLAVLLLHANQEMSVSRLTESLWDQDGRAVGAGALRTQVWALRKLLRPARRLHTGEYHGYRLQVRPGELDAGQFRQLAEQGRHLLESGDLPGAVSRLKEALALWREPPMADVSATLAMSPVTQRLLDERRAARELLTDAPPTPTAAAIRALLDALGAPAERIPASLDAQEGMYRSLMAGKRMLLVLDNARDAEQVRPLLPGSPGCLVVVTSRSHLAGLAAVEGAHSLTLGLLTDAESRARLGSAAIDAEPGAAAELGRLCARLPLALVIAAARVAARPRLRLAAFAGELADAQSRLDALDTGDALASVRAVFSWSAGSLSAPAARMFGLLGVHPGPDITVPAAASLAGVPLPQAQAALAELSGASLAAEHSSGRFSLHDLLRAYAAEQTRASGGESGNHEAAGRVLDHYLHTAYTAAGLLNPQREAITLPCAWPGVTPEHLASRQLAQSWLEAEHDVLISAVSLAGQTRFDLHAWQLPWAIANFLDWRGYWDEWAATQRTALVSATRLGDAAAQAVTRRLLGQACARLGDYGQARAQALAQAKS